MNVLAKVTGSAFGISVNEMNIAPLLLYLNSSDFWKQIETTMPPMGTGHRSIRISTLKKLLIPRRIAFPMAHDVLEAQFLEKQIVHAVRRKQSERIRSIFAALDSFIERIIVLKNDIEPDFGRNR